MNWVWIRRAAGWQWCIVILALALGRAQIPPFHENQATYLLHGVAAADGGGLAEDWLVRTRDPVPLFSVAIRALRLHAPDHGFEIAFAVLAAVFYGALVVLGAQLGGIAGDARRRSAYGVTLLVVLSAGISCALSSQWTLPGTTLVEGVAQQRVLGYYLDASTCGVWLVLALALFGARHEVLAALCAAAGAALHPTYLAAAGVIVLACGVARARRTGLRGAAVLPLIAGGAVLLPVVLYCGLALGGDDPAARAEAHRFLVEHRLPHHAVPRIWFRPAADVVRGLVVVAGLALAWRTRLALPFAGLLAWGALGTTVVVATDDPTLALLFPWRVSAVLVPVSTALVLAALVRLFVPALAPGGRAAGWGRGLVLVGVAALVASTGMARTAAQREAQARDPDRAVWLRIAATPDAHGTYLIPPRGLDTFRLDTGQPVVVDRKSHPFEPGELLEWKERLQWAERFHREQGWRQEGWMREARNRYGATHLLVPAKAVSATPDHLEVVIASERWCALRLRAPGERGTTGFRLEGGWHGGDQLPSASDGAESVIQLWGDPTRPWNLELSWRPRLYGRDVPRQRVIVEVDGAVVAELSANDFGTRQDQVEVPARAADAANRLVLRFPDAFCPAERGFGPDRRKLAMDLVGLRIVP